ncbi:siderophore ABC transporter substrate-binding protein [Sediminibacillus halophilus]|uniref:Iron complex transport system substrate-binding protein n=1 Tax=Sediminibacillus halophilus TaxID=482461 RepID=A0A1G9R229_9BACI|nr:siderophore ABC transporter substrate-binding protein [Sediminibacillus halophilus]SDM16907.1 iron complex transport system substrate-binding protein [Sediminibacillus halophilus]
MTKRLAMLISILILAVFTAACGNQSSSNEDAAAASDNGEKEQKTVTVEHELGKTEVPVNPEKVVVFDFGTLDTLKKLGVDVTAVPKENLPSYLSDYDSEEYENAGTLFEPDFEKLSEIDPDLIIISGRTAEAYDDLNELAPTIHLGVDTTRYMDSFKENATVLGKIFGKESQVEEELAAIDEQISELNEKASASEKDSLIILTNDGSINAYGPGSRFGVIHDVFGFQAVDENIEASTHGQNISFEYLVENDPDYLFVVDRNQVVGGESSAEKTLDNKLVQDTKAYKDENIVYLNPDYWYLSGGGLISVSEMVNEVASSME